MKGILRCANSGATLAVQIHDHDVDRASMQLFHHLSPHVAEAANDEMVCHHCYLSGHALPG